jgi:phage gpG-like protein
MSVAIVTRIDGLQRTLGNVDALKAYLGAILPYKQAATVVTASVQRNFVAGGRPQKWEELSPLTRFIRAHRRGKQNLNPVPLRDTGRLEGSVVPHAAVDAQGGTFGAKTNVSYARKMHEGGVTTASEVVIDTFIRNARTGESRVRSYVMHLKGGKRIPARPFMMVQEADKTVIRQIFMDWLKGAADGKYGGK